MAQPPREEAQEAKAVATVAMIAKITIVFLIFVVFKIETINCLDEMRKWIPGNSSGENVFSMVGWNLRGFVGRDTDRHFC